MAENGFFYFFAEYIYELIETLRQTFHDENFRILSMEQLSIPLMLVFCIHGIAFWIFLVEVIVFVWRYYT